ncbi:MAG: PilN domain-containing protein [Saccharospirillaceae bacterium]|nr:PilN domain-containing protein [Pseudomonadales bacterium]NRB78275.1 PilN domain-containing protein [Saccharospirillaceae bacterium]
MANINLRPWRQERRDRLKKEFFNILVLVLIVSGVIASGWYFYTTKVLDNQIARVQMIEKENSRLIKIISEIKELNQKKANLLRRMNTVADLNSNRSQPVEVFQEFVTLVPKGVYLTELSRKGDNISLSGVADRVSSVSDFYRSIELSDSIKEDYVPGSVKNRNPGNPNDESVVFSIKMKLKSNQEEQ